MTGGGGYSGFDPIEDTERAHRPGGGESGEELQWVRSDRGY